MTFEEWVKIAHEYRVEKGWWDDPNRSIYSALIHIMCELAEVAEEIRDGRDPKVTHWSRDKRGNLKPEGVPSELADVVLLAMDFAGQYGIDLESAMLTKMSYNFTRSGRKEKAAERGTLQEKEE